MVHSPLLQQYSQISHVFDSDEPEQSIFQLKQIHSDTIIDVSYTTERGIQADAMITGTNIPIGIRTADCLPALLFDPKLSVIAAVHAGWKGLAHEILPKTVAKLKEKGTSPSDIIVAIGPHIRSCCYHVDDERMKLFKSKTKYLDLGLIAATQLRKCGIQKSNIEISTLCTYCTGNLPSYRRDGDKARRMISYIKLENV